MLVAISDLHLLDETAGAHNPPATAFSNVFLPHIVELARRNGAREFRLLLLGDIFDLLRTEIWLDAPFEERPWGSIGRADVPTPAPGSATEQWALRIMGTLDNTKSDATDYTILARNWKLLAGIRGIPSALRDHLGYDIPVHIIYIPGNHDRMVNLYPSLRNEAARQLGVVVSPETAEVAGDGEWWFRNDYIDHDHGVYARHGHQYDLWNFGGGNDFTRQGHLKMPIGDLLGVEFGAKLPHRLASYIGEVKGITPEFVAFMKEMGLVRPFTHALQWLHYAVRRQESTEARKLIDRLFDEIVGEILEMDAIRTCHTPNSLVDNALRAASRPWLRWLSKAALRHTDIQTLLPFFAGIGGDNHDPDHDVHLKAAYNERRWREDPRIHCILYGHTHVPMQRPLDAEQGHEITYINTGTWRDSIFRTTMYDREHDFVKFGQISYNVFYRSDEAADVKPAGQLAFETWHGTRKTVGKSGDVAKTGPQ